MATFNQRDIGLLFLGAAADITTGGIDTLNEGEVGIFTPAGTRLTEATAATATEFIIVASRGSSNPPTVSGIIKKADIKSASLKTYEAAVEQVDHIGFNGSAGAITVINDNNYTIRLSLRQNLVSNHGGLYIKHGLYKSDATATQEEIAAKLHEALVAEFSKEADDLVKVERLCAATTAAVAETYSPRKGSQYVLASAAPTVVVGEIIRFGAATTDASYLVTAVDTTHNIVTLDVKFQGEDADAVAVTNAAAGTDWGLKISGVPLKFVTGKLHYNKVAWDLSIEDFGATAITKASSAKAGSGTAEQVKELEFFLQGNEGEHYRVGEPNIFPARKDATGNYSLIHINTEEIATDSIVAGPIKAVYTLAIPETTPNYALTATAEDITDVLEVLAFGSATGDLDLG